MEVLDLFSAAAGGWSLGMHRAGFKTIAACENVDWRRAIYQENNPDVLIYDDVCTLTADRIIRDTGRFPPIVVGSRARISPAPTQKAKASKASAAGSTSKQSASSEKAVLVGSLLKTALISELGALTPSSLHWKHSATPAGRSWYVLGTSEPIMSGPEAGSLAATSPKFHTPTAMGNMHHPSMSKWESCVPWRIALATPRKTDADRGFRGDVLAQLQGQNNRHAGMLSTPRASDMKAGGHGDTGRMGSVRHQLQVASQETLPTPTKRDKRMDAWSPAYDKRKSPTMDAVLDGAMTDRASDKWQYAREIASTLQHGGLTGPSMTLPLTYNWMMGFPPGWLARALQSAVRAGRLQQVSSLKRSETQSSRKSRKQ